MKQPLEKKMTEQDLARYIIKWLEADGWDVFQEVKTGDLCPIADIVAVKNGLSWIIETKTSYGLAVLDQACRWLRWNAANFISVAVLYTKKRKGSASHYFHKDKGIGLISVDLGGHISTIHRPRLIRTRKDILSNIKNCLCDAHKHFAEAGAANGGYFTEFKQTTRDISRYVKEHPGTTIKEMIDNVGVFHYANPQSAKGAIAKYLRSGIIEGITVKIEGRKHRLYREEI